MRLSQHIQGPILLFFPHHQFLDTIIARERERERESGAGAFFSPLLRAAALPATRDSLLFFVHALCVCFLIAFHFLFFPRGLKEFERERERERDERGERGRW